MTGYFCFCLEPFCLQQFVEGDFRCVGILFAYVYFYSLYHTVKLFGADTYIERKVHARVQHRFSTANTHQYRYGHHFALCIGQYITFEDIGKQMFFEEGFYFGAESGIAYCGTAFGRGNAL